MRDRLDDLGDETDVVLLTFTDADNIPAYREQHQLDLNVLVDRNRSAYKAYGLGRGSIRRVWGFRAAKKYFDLIRSGGFSRLAAPSEDTLQLGGDFIIDKDGVLIYGFWGEGPDDRPQIDELVRALDAPQAP